LIKENFKHQKDVQFLQRNLKMENSNESIFLEDCKTCSFNYSSKCFIRYDPKLAQRCPCRNCIIKMICSKVCKERILSFTSLPYSIKSFLSDEDYIYKKGRQPL